jgi:hypothetical protein
MMLAKPYTTDTQLVGNYRLLDNIADDLRMGQHLPIGARLNVAEGVKTKFDLLRHPFVSSIP